MWTEAEADQTVFIKHDWCRLKGYNFTAFLLKQFRILLRSFHLIWLTRRWQLKNWNAEQYINTSNSCLLSCRPKCHRMSAYLPVQLVQQYGVSVRCWASPVCRWCQARSTHYYSVGCGHPSGADVSQCPVSALLLKLEWSRTISSSPDLKSQEKLIITIWPSRVLLFPSTPWQ